MVKPRTILFDGVKAININNLPEEAWTILGGGDKSDLRTRYRHVPWLYRGVQMRADMVKAMPFDLTSAGGEVYDTSEDWQNKVGFLPNPGRLLWLLEACLTLLPAAYLYREQNRVVTTTLRFILTNSIEPVIDEKSGLTGFKRRLGTNTIDLGIKDLVYFWRPDPFTEIGPATETSPAYAAMQAAGVLYNLDEFASTFFERGAIRATILKAGGNPAQQEKDRIKRWWKRVFSGGMDTAFAAEVVSADMEIEQIGEGIGDLSDSALSSEKREDISTALGIPHSILFANAANYATAQQDKLNFLDSTIVPEAQWIAAVLTEQVFEPLGLRMNIKHETLDAYQEDEAERAQSFAQYVQSGLRRSVAAQMVGLELPQGVEYADLDTQYEEDREARMPDFSQFNQGPPQQGQQDRAAQQEAMRADLRRWRTKARKAGGAVSFESEFIPPAMKASLDGAIETLGVEDAFAFLDGVKKKS